MALQKVPDVLPGTFKQVELPNRAKRLADARWAHGRHGRAARLEAKQSRRKRLQKARLVLKEIRKATIRAMRLAR